MATRRSDHEEPDEEALFIEYASSRDRSLRERLILKHLDLVRRLVRQVRPRPDLEEDLLQVGYVGLIKAIDRYDPRQGSGFASYAGPTVLGEIRHFIRDRARLVRVPRHVQEQQVSARRACDMLTQQLGREPTADELAKTLGERAGALSRTDAVNGATLSLDQFTDDDESTGLRPPKLGQIDDELERVENRYDLSRALSALSRRERAIMCYYFFAEMTQAEIGERLQLSQMHVSRLHRTALRRLRGGIGTHSDLKEVEKTGK